MKPIRFIGWSSALFLSVFIAQAQETTDSEKLSKQLKELQNHFEQQQRELRENFEKQQKELREKFEKMAHEQQLQIELLKQQIATKTNGVVAVVQTNSVSTNAPDATPNSSTAQKIKELSDKVDSVIKSQTKVLPSEFNPSIGLVGETLFSYRSQGAESTGSERAGGFDAYQRSVEINAAASVDPFVKAYVVANASADAETGDSTLGIEEAAIQTLSLPGNLELKAGRFFGEFGKLSYIHDHELPFVNRPLALDQYVGGESRTDGAQVNWLLPIPQYVSLTVGAGNGFGGDSPLNNPGTYRHLSGFNYFGRVSTYFDLTPNFQLETGASGLINPSTQDRGGAIVQSDNVTTFTEKERKVGGFDMRLSYVPLRDNQFQRVDWGSEILFSDSRYQVSPLDDTVDSFASFHRTVGSVGGYSYVTYKWHRQWSGGFLFDYVQDAQNHNNDTYAFSPYLTWAISHWNQLRLQYTHTEPSGDSLFRTDDAIYLQWAWIIGSHAHGWQQR